MRLVELQLPADVHVPPDSRGTWYEHYSHSAPFFYNPRGILLHRVRALRTFHYPSFSCKEDHHTIVDYWCTSYGFCRNDNQLLFDPADPVVIGKRLVCQTCETNAVAAGQPTSSELCGRHICVGSLRVVNCCHANVTN